MSFTKLVINNVLRSGKTYGSYFLSSAFSVFVFFIFSMLFFHPQLKDGLGGSSGEVAIMAELGMAASQVLIVLLSLFFLWYSFWTFVKARKRDLGIYLMLGMKPADLRKLLFFENMLIGLGASFTGIALGLIFSKALLIIFQSMLKLTAGLAFYLPGKAIALTLGVYTVLFFVVSMSLTFRLHKEKVSQLSKSDEIPQPLPKTHPVLALSSLVCLGGGYGLLYTFVNGVNRTELILLGCVLLTVAGTYLFFSQGTVYLYQWLRRLPMFWRGKGMLTIAEGLYHAKNNASMYALITCTAAVALVGICVTSALGGAENGSRSAITPAYVLSSELIDDENWFKSFRQGAPFSDASDSSESDDSSESGQMNESPELEADPAVRELGEQVSELVAQGGYDPIYDTLVIYPLDFTPDERLAGGEYGDGYHYVYVMRASDYNRLAEKMNVESLHPKEDELLEPAANVTDYNEIQAASPEERSERMTFETSTGETRSMIRRRVAVRFQLDRAYGFAVAADSLVDEIPIRSQKNLMNPMYYQIIHFEEWQTAEQTNDKVLSLLKTRFDEVSQLFSDRMYSSDEEEPSDEQLQLMLEAEHLYFHYDSKYQTWIEQRQSNGLILMIGVLLGAVFFIFAASIMYFRLFGDLDKEGRYHRSLYRLGLPPKQRHQIVTRQMLVMYFAPMLMAIVHTSVAFWGLNALSGLNLWGSFWLIILTYVAFLTLLFLFSRWRYLIHLDVRAEQSQAF